MKPSKYLMALLLVAMLSCGLTAGLEIKTATSQGDNAPFPAGTKIGLGELGDGQGEYEITAENMGTVTDATGTKAIKRWTFEGPGMATTWGWSYDPVVPVPSTSPCGCGCG